MTTTTTATTSSILRALLFGQLISFLVAMGALFSKLLVDVGNVSCPALQSAIGYCFLFLTFGSIEYYYRRPPREGFLFSDRRTAPRSVAPDEFGSASRTVGIEPVDSRGDGGGGHHVEGQDDALMLMEIATNDDDDDDDDEAEGGGGPSTFSSTKSSSPKTREAKKVRDNAHDYSALLNIFFISIADSQADYLGNLAYTFGVSIASVGLLSSFTIPCAMVLSYFILRARYSRTHFFGVLAALVGLVFVVLGDVLAGEEKPEGEGRDSVIGDLLVLLGSSFYAITNVASENLMKRRGEMSFFLARLGFFGFLISTFQSLVLEQSAVGAIRWTESPATLYLLLYGLYFCVVYGAISLFLMRHDAVLLNLSMLTTDVWGIVFSLFIFGEPFRVFTGLGFVFVVGGLTVYNLAPAPTVAIVEGESPDDEQDDMLRERSSLPVSRDEDLDEEEVSIPLDKRHNGVMSGT